MADILGVLARSSLRRTLPDAVHQPITLQV